MDAYYVVFELRATSIIKTGFETIITGSEYHRAKCDIIEIVQKGTMLESSIGYVGKVQIRIENWVCKVGR